MLGMRITEGKLGKFRRLLWGGACLCSLLVLTVLVGLYQGAEQVSAGYTPLLVILGVCCLGLLLGGTVWVDSLARDQQARALALEQVQQMLQEQVKQVQEVEQQIEQSERWFRQLFSASPMGMYLYELKNDDALILIDANDAADRMTGIRNRELVGKRIEEAFPALQSTEIPDRYKAAAREGVAWHTRTFAYEDSQIKGAFEVYAFQTVPGSMAVMFLEVTERERAERGLRDNEQRYRALFESASDAIVIGDAEGFTGCNQRALDMFGCSREEFVGKIPLDFSPPLQPDGSLSKALYQQRVQAALQGETQKFEWEHCRPDGSRFTADICLNRLEVADGILLQALIRDISEQKRAELALRESEARFRRLAENAQDMIYRMSLPDGLYQYMSPAAASITGYSPQEWYDNPRLIKRIIHPDWQSYFEREWENLLRGEMPPTYEYQIFDKQGRVRWLYQRNVLIRNTAGQPVAIEGIITDITDRRQAEEAVAQSQALLVTALEQTPAGIIIADAPDGTIRLVNSAGLGIRGGDRQSLVDIPIEQHPQQWKTRYPDGRLYEPQDLPLSRAILHGEVVTNELVAIERVDGQPRWVLANAAPVRNKDGQIVAGIVVFPDVTEQKEAERRLRFTQFTVDQAKIAVFWCHADGRFFYVNDTACTWLQYTREEMMQMHVADINPEFPREAWGDHWQEIKAKGMVRMESVHQRKNGEIYPVEIYSNYVQHEGKEYKLAFVHDISERREAEVKLAAYRNHLEDLVEHRTTELKRANRELESFAYSVSHDLRAPLRSMDGFSQAMMEDYADAMDDQGLDYLRRIRRAASRMGILIDDLLSLSRVGRCDMKHQVVDLTEMAGRLLEMFRQQAPERQVECDIAEGMTAWGDPGLLELALQNLLGNAWKFTQETPRPIIRMFGGERDGQRYFAVGDNGAGFDMAYADKLFGVFQRLHKVQEFEGTGIGLATVERIVLRHGGRIWAEAAVGQGATFYFTLPAAEDTMRSKERVARGDVLDES